ncbi:hypothetical protein D3C76_1186090 [compost metagenome]
MLSRAIAQRPPGLQAQAEDIHSRPVRLRHRRRQAVAQRIEHLDGEVLDHPALAGQPPALRTPRRIERPGQRIEHLAVAAAHQAGVATAGAAAEGHGDSRLAQGVQQVGAVGHRPLSRPGLDFRHVVLLGNVCRPR